MAEVLELEIDTAERSQDSERIVRDTWIFKLPSEVCRKEGFAEGTMVSLTIKDGGVLSSIIRPPSERLQNISKKILEKDRQLYEELKKIGD